MRTRELSSSRRPLNHHQIQYYGGTSLYHGHFVHLQSYALSTTPNFSTRNVVVIEEQVAQIRRYATVPTVVATTLAVCVALDVIHNGVVNHNRSLGFLTQ
jgi:hypothetical protein